MSRQAGSLPHGAGNLKTCGMMGEIVGKAAALCVKDETSPRGVYENHLPKLKALMKQPGATRVS